MIDFYNVEYGEGKEMSETSGEVPFIYPSVNYHPIYYRTKQYSDADIIFTKIGQDEELLAKVGDNKYLDDYIKRDFLRYTIHVKVNH